MEYIIRRTSDHLEHHGILGQKWGVRRFQNPDGSLTAEGKKRYGLGMTKGIDTAAYFRYDKKANPHKYGRLDDEQKKKYWKEREEIEDLISERANYAFNNEEVWNKAAKGYAEEQYKEAVSKGEIEDNSRNKKEFIEDIIKESRGSIDTSTYVWDYFGEHDPKTKALNDRAEKWIQNIIENEKDNGYLNYGEITRQFYEHYIDGLD